MDFFVYRDNEDGRATQGEICLDADHVCYTLEPSSKTPAHVGHPDIPCGR
jgi:hypothetical protein